MTIANIDGTVATALCAVGDPVRGIRRLDRPQGGGYRLVVVLPVTTFRHSATSKLHASWQSSGTVVAGVDLSAVVSRLTVVLGEGWSAKADDPGPHNASA